MPTYQYVCTECGDQIEAVQKFTDDPLTVHEDCGGRLRKVFSAVGIVFKGSGFYRTDSRNGSVAPGSSSSSEKSGDKSGSDSSKPGSGEKSEKSSSSSSSDSSKSGGDKSSSSSSSASSSSSSAKSSGSSEKVA